MSTVNQNNTEDFSERESLMVGSRDVIDAKPYTSTVGTIRRQVGWPYYVLLLIQRNAVFLDQIKLVYMHIICNAPSRQTNLKRGECHSDV